MVNYRKILELHFDGTSQRSIEAAVGSSRNTIREVVSRAKDKKLLKLTDDMSNSWLEEFLFPEKLPSSKGFLTEDWEYVHKELGKKHVTLRLLHNEYCQKAEQNNQIPYSYRSYCRFYNDYANKYKVTMPLRRKPGELMEVDWAGANLFLKNKSAESDIPVYIFVACLPFSQIFYVEGFLNMKTESWITGHINAFEYFGGVAEVLVPDNLKTGVTKSNYLEPDLNPTYRDLADYYETAIVPTRVRHPKDKASVESNVGFISRHVIAALRNEQCFYLEELNALIFEKFDQLNKAPFQKKAGSRQSVFEEEEKLYLNTLRKPRFQITDWKVAKVQANYHIQVERNYYSVPFEYTRCQVDVKVTKDLIEVYFKDSRIASHKRIKNKINVYSTNKEHMPKHHREYIDHTPEQCQHWADKIGPKTRELVDMILDKQSEKRALKIISGIQKLENNYSKSQIEATSELLLLASSNPSLRLFKEIIKRQSNIGIEDPKTKNNTKDENHGFVRGAEYFGGNR